MRLHDWCKLTEEFWIQGWKGWWWWGGGGLTSRGKQNHGSLSGWSLSRLLLQQLLVVSPLLSPPASSLQYISRIFPFYSIKFQWCCPVAFFTIVHRDHFSYASSLWIDQETQILQKTPEFILENFLDHKLLVWWKLLYIKRTHFLILVNLKLFFCTRVSDFQRGFPVLLVRALVSFVHALLPSPGPVCPWEWQACHRKAAALNPVHLKPH